MNCNDAFEQMTDPIRNESVELTQHLAGCPRCRQMRETLAPALEWLQFAQFDTDQSPWLNGETGTSMLLSPEAVHVAQDTAARLPRQKRRHHRERLQQWMAMAVMAIFGVGLGAFFVQPGRTSPPSGTVGAASPLLASCLWQERSREADGQPLLAANVVASCVSCHVPAQATP